MHAFTMKRQCAVIILKRFLRLIDRAFSIRCNFNKVSLRCDDFFEIIFTFCKSSLEADKFNYNCFGEHLFDTGQFKFNTHLCSFLLNLINLWVVYLMFKMGRFFFFFWMNVYTPLFNGVFNGRYAFCIFKTPSPMALENYKQS